MEAVVKGQMTERVHSPRGGRASTKDPITTDAYGICIHDVSLNKTLDHIRKPRGPFGPDTDYPG